MADYSLSDSGDIYNTLGLSLFYYFTNTSDDDEERISYLAANLYARLGMKFTEWLEVRSLAEFGLGIHVGTRILLADSNNLLPEKTV